MSRRQSFPWVVGLALGAGWLVTKAPPAYGDETGPGGAEHFTLEVKACPQVSVESVRRILNIEIGDLLLDEAAGAPADSDRLSIRCVDDVVWVEAAGQSGGPQIERTFRLDDFPGDAASRALALIGLELLAARSSTMRQRIASKQNATVPAEIPIAAAPQPPRLSPPSRREGHVGLAGAWRTFWVARGLSAWGGQVQASSTFRRIWHLAADAEVVGARNKANDLGETSALLTSCGALIGLRGGGSNLGASFGLGGRIGVARLSGSSANSATITGSTVWRPWGGPMVAASAFSELGRIRLTLTAETGFALGRAEGLAGDDTAIAIRGAWMAIVLGGAFRL